MFKQIVLGVVSLTLGVAGAKDYALIDPANLTATASTTTGNGNGSRKPICAVDGSGMNEDGTHAADKADGQMWEPQSVSTVSPAWFRVDLGASHNLGGIKIWNYNWGAYANRGAKNMEIYCTDDASLATLPTQAPIGYVRSNWTPIQTDYVLPLAPGDKSYAGADMLTFEAIPARYIVFVISSHWGGGNGGLSEVRFYEPVYGEGETELTQMTLTKDASGFVVSGRIAHAAAVAGSIAEDGNGNVFTYRADAETAADDVFSIGIPEGLAADTTYQISAIAENAASASTNVLGTVYTGMLTFSDPVAANEMQCVPGSLTVSRAHADPYPLTVDYAFSSVQGTGAGKTWVAPTPVTIPAGQTSATIVLTPMVDLDIDSDIGVTVTLMATASALGAEPATIRLVNLVPPDGYNVWIAKSAGRASDALNWSENRVPTATDNVLFSGYVSNADCEWDGAAAQAVASWTQRDGYSGTVSVATTFADYSTDFTNLTVTGSVVLDAGKLAPKAHGTTTDTRYRLMMTVCGNFSVGAEGKVYATGLGRYINHSAWRGEASHGGECVGNKAATATVNSAYPAFGSILEPTSVAYGSSSGTDAESKKSNGGGAIYLKVAGDFTNAGEVVADGGVQYAAAGAGGSVYVSAANIRGAGKYSAQPQKQGKTDGSGANGAGGRLALVAQGVNEATNITCDGAREGWGSYGAPGTVYLKSASTASILVKGTQQTESQLNRASTPIPAADDPMNWRHCARGVDLIGSTCAHLRLTKDYIRVKSLSLLSAASNPTSGGTYRQSDLDLAGKTIEVKSVIIDGEDLKLPNGEYRLAQATEKGWDWLKDTSAEGAGVLVVRKDGFAIRIR